MSIVVFKTEFRCKFCKSGRRDEIDAILEKRSLGLTDEAGVKVNLSRALEMIAALGVENPTKDNINSHWNGDPTKAHSYYAKTEAEAKVAGKGKQIVDIVPPEELKGRRAIIEKVLPGWIADPWPLTPDEVAAATQAIGMYDAMQRFLKGEKSGITVDHALKGGDLATKRNVNDAAVELMKYAGLAVGASVKAALETGERSNLKQLGPVEHEVVEVGVAEDADEPSR